MISVISDSSIPDAVCILLGFLLYVVSLVIALSPVGETILRLQLGCGELNDEKSKLVSCFRNVYSKAKMQSRGLPDDIDLFMSDDNDMNAFATGRKTVCVTKGLLALDASQIEGVLAHEFGHLANKDTDWLLVVQVGNLFVSLLFLLLKTICRGFNWLIGFIIGIILGEDSVISNAVHKFVDFVIFIVFEGAMWLWTKLGLLICLSSQRSNEYEADKYACIIGYKSSLISALSVIDNAESQGESKGLWSAIWSTHPETADRIKKMNSFEYIPSKSSEFFCPHCGELIDGYSPDMKRCPICRKPLKEETPSEPPEFFCPWCGELIEGYSPDMKRCPVCRKPLKEETPFEPPEFFCPWCGELIDGYSPDMKRCPICRKPLKEETPFEPPEFFCPWCGELIEGYSPDMKRCPVCREMLPEPIGPGDICSYDCLKCGSPIKDIKFNFCLSCGIALPKEVPPAPSEFSCPRCGELIEGYNPDMKHCPLCGKSFNPLKPPTDISKMIVTVTAIASAILIISSLVYALKPINCIESDEENTVASETASFSETETTTTAKQKSMCRVKTMQSKLNLRREPSLDAEVLDKIDNSSTVELLETDGEWSYVDHDGMRGWVKSEFLVSDSAEEKITKRDAATTASNTITATTTAPTTKSTVKKPSDVQSTKAAINTYTVSFDPCGGSVSRYSTSTVAGKCMEMPLPVRTGYTFNGWYTSANGGTRYTSSSPITSDLELYAHWTAEIHTVRFDYNGGSGSVSSKSVSYGSTMSMPSASKTGYTFNGWYTSANDGTRYTSSSPITSDLELYAHWTAEIHTVRFDYNGGSGSVSSKSISYGSTMSMPSASRTGYTFNGWYTLANGGTKYTSETEITSDITLYAHWSVQQYTVRFDYNGGSGSVSYKNASYGTSVLLPTATRSGYKFDGWYTTASGGTKYTSETEITSDITLYAHWLKSSIKLSYYSKSESININKTSTYNSFSPTYVVWSVPLPSVTKENISGGSGNWEVINGPAMIDNNVVYQYQPGTIRLKYTQNGVSSSEYTYTLRLYKITSASNTMYKYPNDTKIGSVPANTTVYIDEFKYGTSALAKHQLWAKVTYENKTGWIPGLSLDQFMS